MKVVDTEIIREDVVCLNVSSFIVDGMLMTDARSPCLLDVAG